ncbi:hypothetical protein [Nocardia amamiensis]|uniref:hypothetical protein n=1 Tax=Nocardia amamiensis TaxID=404578 RepID=UPI000AD857E3|nr:hypothetical protein [Nocardia amamiensis]
MVTRATPAPGAVLGWDVSALADIADRSNQIADVILKTSNSMHSVIRDLPWQGQARDAAENKADREQMQMRTIAAAFYDLGTACAGAARDMGYPLAEIKTIFQHYVTSPVTVADDWSITGVDDWSSEAGTQLARLNGLVSALAAADAQWGAKIADANERLQLLESTEILFQAANDGLAQPPGGWSNDPGMRMAQEIAYGHAWGKHRKDFKGMTQDELAEKVYQIIQGPQMERLGKDKVGNPVMMSYDGFIVMIDPSTTDHGTVYRPDDPLGEFIRLTNQTTDPSLDPGRVPGGTGGTPPGKPGGNR